VPLRAPHRAVPSPQASVPPTRFRCHGLAAITLAARVAQAGLPALLALATQAAHAAEPQPPALPVVRVTAPATDATTEGTGAYTARSANTATRLDLSLRETPQSISVVTRTQMDDFALHSVNKLLANTTGVTVERVETDRTYFTARGFDISNFQLDGVGLPFATGDQLGDIDTAVYDRVEVLRGANGLMSSTGNPSATINFVRKRPTADRQASAALSLGSWNSVRLDGDLAGPLNEAGSVRYRVVAAAEKGDSYLDRYSLEKGVFYGVVEADLSPDLLLTAGVTRQANRPDSPMWGALPLAYSDGTPTHYDVSANTSADWAYWNTDDTTVFTELTRDLGEGWKAKATATHRVLASDGEMFYVYGVPDPDTGAGLGSWPSKYNHEERQALLDMHVTGPLARGGRNDDVVLGASWSRSNNKLRSSDDDVGEALTEDEVLQGAFPRPAFDHGVTGQADFVDERLTGYAAVRFNLADDLKLLTGLNVTDVRSRGQQYGEPHFFSVTKATPYVGAVYDLDSQYSVYGNYAGIFNPQSKIDADKEILPPVKGNNLEAGIKGEWLDKKLNGSASVFRVKQDNASEFDTTVLEFDETGDEIGRFTAYKPVNATSTGFELDLAGTLAHGMEVTAGYAQMQIDNDQGEAARMHVPRKLAHFSGVCRLPALKGLAVGMNLRWQDDISQGTSKQDAYALLDLMARYDIGKNLSATVNLNNVTDEKYLTSLQWTQSYYGPPRHGSVTLRWQY
jgi:outer membrane receptor for ferric coprogen and ferric-rhodotorulic acid